MDGACVRDLTGQVIGQYRIMERVGKGAMAVVYRAHQPAIDRIVAVKILLGEYTRRQDFLERFRCEAEATALLRHFHVLPIYDYGEVEGVPYLVVPFIDNGTLADLLKRGPLELDEALRLGGQIASALDHAHSRGVIHRDVKPSNVLIDNDGNVLLADFGLAKLAGSDAASPGGTDAMIGTPDYMSPEQCLGLPADARSDVYSLAAMLFEMIAGRVPFRGPTPVATVLLHIDGPIPDLTEAPALSHVIKKGLAKDPDQRYGTAGELIAALYEAAGDASALYAPIPLHIPQADMPTDSTSPVAAGRVQNVAPVLMSEVPKLLSRLYTIAIAEATRLNHGYLGVEHLFIAMARDPGGVLTDVLNRQRLLPDDVARSIAAYVGHGDGALFKGGPRPTRRLMLILQSAVEAARSQGRSTLTQQDLFIAMLREGQSVPIRVLALSGANLQDALEQVQRQAALAPPPPDPGPPRLEGDTPELSAQS
jgi:tRNA A-37 threonylcarbamoyl transferase component Bud32